MFSPLCLPFIQICLMLERNTVIHEITIDRPSKNKGVKCLGYCTKWTKAASSIYSYSWAGGQFESVSQDSKTNSNPEHLSKRDHCWDICCSFSENQHDNISAQCKICSRLDLCNLRFEAFSQWCLNEKWVLRDLISVSFMVFQHEMFRTLFSNLPQTFIIQAHLWGRAAEFEFGRGELIVRLKHLEVRSHWKLWQMMEEMRNDVHLKRHLNCWQRVTPQPSFSQPVGHGWQIHCHSTI